MPFFSFFLLGVGGGSLSSCTCGRIDFACGFCLQLDLRFLLLLRNSILKACCCCCCFSKRKLQKPRLKNRRKHNQFLLTHYWNPPCSSLCIPSSMLHQFREEKILLHMFAFFFVFFEDDIQNQRSSCKTVHAKMVKKPTVSVPNWGRLCFFHKRQEEKALKKKREIQTIPAFTIPLHTLLCQALKSVSTTNQKLKSIKWKAWNCCQKLESCLYNKPETKKINQIKAWNRCKKLDIVARSLTFVSTTTRNKINPIKAWNFVCKRKALNFVLTTQLETWNQSNQSLKLLQTNWSFNFCFKNTTRNMKSIKSKLEIVANKLKLQFLFQEYN